MSDINNTNRQVANVINNILDKYEISDRLDILKMTISDLITSPKIATSEAVYYKFLIKEVIDKAIAERK